MKTWINTRARIALLFAALTLVSTLAFAAPNAAADNEQITQLLDQLGLRALIEQTPTVLASAVEAEAQFRHMNPQAVSWRRELEAQLKPQLLLQALTRYLHDHYRVDTFRQAQQRLQEPLVKRARYFDFAMTQAGAEKNLRDYLLQNGLSQSGLSPNGQPQNKSSQNTLAPNKSEQSDGAVGESGTEARLAMLREIDAATASSLLMATLQSAIAARVHQVAGTQGVDAAVDPKILEAEIVERQRYLAPLTADYLFYDYRYLRDDELRDYRDLMRDSAVQWLLDVGRQGVLNAIVGELTPPPSPPR